MKKIICVVFMTSFYCFCTAQSGTKVLYDSLGLHLYYSYEYYNTIQIKEDQYDQYKVTGYVSYDGDNPIFVPTHLGFSFDRHMSEITGKYYKSHMTGNEPNYIPYYNLAKKIPNSVSNIDFSFVLEGQQTHSFWVPSALSTVVRFDTSTRPSSITRILKSGYKNECYIYILVNKGAKVPVPDWDISDYIYNFIYVIPYQKKNDWPGGPATVGGCLNGTPLGNPGDKPSGKQEEEPEKTSATTAAQGNNLSHHKEQPSNTKQRRPVEELKQLILKNLRDNTGSYFDGQNTTESDYQLDFEGNTLIINHHRTRKVEGLLKLKTTIIFTSETSLYTNRSINRGGFAFASKEINNKTVMTNYSDVIRRVKSFYDVETDGTYKSPVLNIYGYNLGPKDENFKALRSLVSELTQQL